MTTPGNLALVSVVHVAVEMNIVVCFRPKLLIAVWKNGGIGV